MRKLWACISLSALLVGALIYGLFRQDTWIGGLIGKLLHLPLLSTAGFGAFCAWYLPDFLWGYALTSALFAVKPKHLQTGICCLITTVYGLLWEVLQLFDFMGGTADLWDCIIYIMAALTAFMIEIKMRRVEK